MSEKSAVAKKPAKEVNKSEEIRKVATGMKAKGGEGCSGTEWGNLGR
jgi:hypothetical protein